MNLAAFSFQAPSKQMKMKMLFLIFIECSDLVKATALLLFLGGFHALAPKHGSTAISEKNSEKSMKIFFLTWVNEMS